MYDICQQTQVIKLQYYEKKKQKIDFQEDNVKFKELSCQLLIVSGNG